MRRHWFDKRTFADAPQELYGPEQLAWAVGYNAAVAACVEEQNEVLREELDF